jgi:membrane protein
MRHTFSFRDGEARAAPIASSADRQSGLQSNLKGSVRTTSVFTNLSTRSSAEIAEFICDWDFVGQFDNESAGSFELQAGMNYKTIWSILRKTFAAWNEHEAPRLGAALAFYTILSLAPLVIIVLAIVALVFGHATAQSQLLGQVESMIGHQGSEAVKGMIEQAQKPASGTVASIIGVITLLFGASGVFGELRSALNRMWDVKRGIEGGLWATIKQRFFSFGTVLAVGFLLLVSLTISAALSALGTYFGGFLPVPEFLLSAIDVVVSLAGITALFALIFRYVPDTKIAWKDVWIGAAVTALLFTIGKFLIGLYLGKAAVGSAYGAAGSLVVVIVWVYYSAMIFLFGAEFTHVLNSGRYGQNRRSVRPREASSAIPE